MWWKLGTGAAFAARDRTWWNVVGRGMAEKGYGLFFGKKSFGLCISTNGARFAIFYAVYAPSPPPAKTGHGNFRFPQPVQQHLSRGVQRSRSPTPPVSAFLEGTRRGRAAVILLLLARGSSRPGRVCAEPVLAISPRPSHFSSAFSMFHELHLHHTNRPTPAMIPIQYQ